MSRRIFSCLGLLGFTVACGAAPAVPLSTYASANGQREHPAWERLARGHRVVLVSGPGGACGIREAATLRELRRATDATPEGDAASNAGAPRVLEILTSRVQPGDPGYLALEVSDEAGRVRWLRIPAGGRLDCLLPLSAEVESALSLVGTRQVFAPGRDGCRELHASGRTALALLLESELAVPMEVSGLIAGPRTGSELSAAGVGAIPWLELGDGAVTVRADVVSSCFAPSVPGAAVEVAPVSDLLHLVPERCEVGPTGSTHLICRTTLGIWEGEASSSGIDLRLVRRTLGPVHFMGAHPVAGQGFAKAVVAVTQGQAADPRGSALYAALDAAVEQAIAKESGGLVRIATAETDEITYHVHVEVSDLQIGELREREVTEISQFKVGEKTEANPAHPLAQEAVRLAAAAVQREESDYAQALRDYEAARQAALLACHEAADSLSDESAKSNAHTACDVGGVLSHIVQPSRAELDAAQARFDAARDALARTPTTLTIDVMQDWPYTKREFSRSTSANLRIALRPRGHSAPAVLTLPLSHTWTDYEIAADPAHNVVGHTPEREPRESADGVVPFIAREASEVLAVRLRAALSKAAIEQAKQAYREAGLPPPPGGFAGVDAVAFETVGARMRGALLRGRARLEPGGSNELPLQAASPSPGSCLLAVAVVTGDVPADLTLATASGDYADRRGGSMAYVELCPGDQGAELTLEPLALASQAGCEVRWAVFATASAGRASSPEVADEPALTGETAPSRARSATRAPARRGPTPEQLRQGRHRRQPR